MASFQKYNSQVSKYLANYLANVFEVKPSAIAIREGGKIAIREGVKIGNSSLLKISFSLSGQEIARANFMSKLHGVSGLGIYLPSSDALKSYVPFSMNHVGDFGISSASFTYRTSEHPELIEVLKDSRVNYRIPRHKISRVSEPSITHFTNGTLEGAMSHYFGKPQEEALCIPVEPTDVKYVPEADKQPEHYCIHGESAPVNPFETNPEDAEQLSAVRISLNASRNSLDGRKYLEETLEGLPLPSYGLSLDGMYNGQNGWVSLRTTYKPYIRFFLDGSASDESLIVRNLENLIKLARSLEMMLKSD